MKAKDVYDTATCDKLIFCSIHLQFFNNSHIARYTILRVSCDNVIDDNLCHEIIKES